MHIKVIKGKKYYYESVRVGKKVMSRYIGPADKVRRTQGEEETSEEINDDNFYVG